MTTQSQMSELSKIITELHFCGENLIRLSDYMYEILNGRSVQEIKAPGKDQTPVPDKSSQTSQTEERTVTLEEVRAVLAAKSAAGHRAEVQTLIKECGADRLSAVDPSMYASLMAMAEVL